MLPLSKPGNGAQKIAVAYLSLQDVTGLDFIADEDWILDYLSNSFPCYFLKIVSQSEGFLFSWEFCIGPHLIRFLVLFNQFLIVGFHDFFQFIVFLLAFCFDVVDDLIDISFRIFGDIGDDSGVAEGL